MPITVAAQQDVAVSLYAPGSPVNDHTFPPFAYDPPASYIGTGGNTASATSDDAFPGYPVIPWIFILFAALYLVFTVYKDIAGAQAAIAEGKQWRLDSLFGTVLVLIGAPLYFLFRSGKTPATNDVR